MQKLIKNLNLIWNKFKKNSDEFWNELEEQLISDDVSFDTTMNILKSIKDHTFKENINDIEVIKKLIKKQIIKILNSTNLQNMNFSLTIPTVWMIVGVNGVGKTSTIAKLAKFYSSKGKSVLLTAADTYRAAAFEQIDHYAKLLELPIVHHQRFSDPGAVVFDSLEKAIAKKIDIVMIDTAGRMHTSYNLMEELKKIKKVIFKKINRDADEILIVIDSTTGQNAKFQVDLFNQSINLSGIILTKTDGTSKGGIVLTIKNEFNLPIKFITNGENLENIQYFDSVKFTEMLFN
jgi:fused signal recognition particle receptor